MFFLSLSLTDAMHHRANAPRRLLDPVTTLKRRMHQPVWFRGWKVRVTSTDDGRYQYLSLACDRLYIPKGQMSLVTPNGGMGD